MTTVSPALARISAAVPPPAPLPTIATSASSVDVARERRGVDHFPSARPNRLAKGSSIDDLRGVVMRRDPAGPGIRSRPRRRIAVPRAKRELMQRAVCGAQQLERTAPEAIDARARRRPRTPRSTAKVRAQSRDARAAAPAARTAAAIPPAPRAAVPRPRRRCLARFPRPQGVWRRRPSGSAPARSTGTMARDDRLRIGVEHREAGVARRRHRASRAASARWRAR